MVLRINPQQVAIRVTAERGEVMPQAAFRGPDTFLKAKTTCIIGVPDIGRLRKVCARVHRFASCHPSSRKIDTGSNGL